VGETLSKGIVRARHHRVTKHAPPARNKVSAKRSNTMHRAATSRGKTGHANGTPPTAHAKRSREAVRRERVNALNKAANQPANLSTTTSTS